MSEMAKNNKRLDNERGFTLIELLVSLSILSIVVVIFFSFFTQAALFNQRADTQVAAVNVAQVVMNDLKKYVKETGVPFNNIQCDSPYEFSGSEVFDGNSTYLTDEGSFYILNNNKRYFVETSMCQNEQEKDVALVRLRVVLKEGSPSSSVTIETFDYLTESEVRNEES